MKIKTWPKTLRRILWEDSFDAVELFGSVNAFAWGIWLLTHVHLFHAGAVYKNLDNVAPVYMWGYGFLLLGCLKMIALLSDRYFIRKWVSLIATFIWSFVLISIWQASSSSIIIVLVGEIVLYSMWEFFRHARRQMIRKEIRADIKKLNKHVSS